MKYPARTLFTFFLLIFCLYSNAQPAAWQPRGIGGGGSLFYPTINPANDNEFYIACDMSQLFHSTDFGNTYTQIPFTKLQVSSFSTYEFTSDNTVAYSIANDGNSNYAVRTLDGGNTWNPLPGNPIADEDVYALKADYANPGRVVMDYYGSLYISNNFGVTFSLIKAAANSGAGITLAGIFFDGNTIYIGTNEGILFSSNGGTSFSALSTSGIPAAEKIFSFAAAKAGSVTRFFCVTANATDIYNGIPPYDYYNFAKGVYTLDAGTNVWTPKMNGITIATDFVMFAGMAGNDINTVYLGGSDATTGGNCVLKTSDAGNTWNKVFLTANNQNIRTGWSGQGGDRGWGYGETCFGITVAPNNANKVLFGDFGFVHKTNDGGVNWQQAYINTNDEHPAGASTPQKKYYHSTGLENTSVWQVHWQDANNMFAGFSDINGIRSKDAGVTWSFDFTGNNVNSIYRIVKHISNNTMFAANSGVHDMYQSTRLQDNILDANDAGGRIIYSTDNGAAWQVLHPFNHPVFWLATDPNNVNRMYASVIHYGAGSGQGGIWVTNDLNNLGSSIWTKLSNPPRTEGHPASIVVLNDGKMVCSFSGRRNSSGTFTASSGVFMYDPVANSWTDVSHPDMQYWTKDIIIDPADPTQNTWWACVFSGWGGPPNEKGGLFKTTNRGASWIKLTGTQFDRVTSITLNPSVSNQAYLTTEIQGLWISNTMNAATPSFTLVNSYPFRQPERVFFNPYNANEIWVASFGNGLRMGVQSVVLPVKLISFSGSRNNTISTLQWATVNEDNNDQFIIERSTDGINFTKAGQVTGNGNAANQYSYTDIFAAPLVYYRIKVIGTAATLYSNIIVLKENSNLLNVIRMLQNPVKETISIEAIVKNAGTLRLALTDLTGKILLQQQIAVNSGTNQLNIALPPACANGMYILKVEGEGIQKSLRVVVK